ncbi:MAG: SDR family NAD(P)-dependent oxidoreductase [Anaerolineae bacterium]|nr:SDR family NAD(P)-dependent oxidoreductase [Anaerolineae bacterium]
MVWQEKIVVITGGASDLGQAVARFFAEQGATVILADRAREALEAARAAVGGGPSRRWPTWGTRRTCASYTRRWSAWTCW